MDPRIGRVLERFPCPSDILFVRTSQSTNLGTPDLSRDLPDGLKITRRRNREPCLDHVDAHINQRLSDLHFFLEIHTRPGRLLAVTKRGVEDFNVARFRHRKLPD